MIKSVLVIYKKIIKNYLNMCFMYIYIYVYIFFGYKNIYHIYKSLFYEFFNINFIRVQKFFDAVQRSDILCRPEEYCILVFFLGTPEKEYRVDNRAAIKKAKLVSSSYKSFRRRSLRTSQCLDIRPYYV